MKSIYYPWRPLAVIPSVRRLCLFLLIAPGWLGSNAVKGATTEASPADAAELSLASPLEYQVFQRQSKTQGSIVIEGSWSIPRHAKAFPDKLEGRLLAPGAAENSGEWTALPFASGARGFRVQWPEPAGGWYRLEIRLLRHGQVMARQTVRHVGVGDVFLIAGQSNSANYGEERQRPASGLVSAFDGERWQLAEDPQPGATGGKGSFIPSFGDALVQKYNVPVGVVCIGVGSTSVREWMPRGTEMANPPTTGAHALAVAGGHLISSGELFNRLAGRLQAFGPHGIRAILWHQGESDWNQSAGHEISADAYAADLAELIAASRAAAGWAVPWFVAQASYHSPTDPGSKQLRAAQLSVVDDRLTFAGPDTDELGQRFREKDGQGVHFNDAGLKRHGEWWAQIVTAWIDRH